MRCRAAGPRKDAIIVGSRGALGPPARQAAEAAESAALEPRQQFFFPARGRAQRGSPMVVMNVSWKASSQNLSKMQVFPTPASKAARKGRRNRSRQAGHAHCRTDGQPAERTMPFASRPRYRRDIARSKGALCVRTALPGTPSARAGRLGCGNRFGGGSTRPRRCCAPGSRAGQCVSPHQSPQQART